MTATTRLVLDLPEQIAAAIAARVAAGEYVDAEQVVTAGVTGLAGLGDADFLGGSPAWPAFAASVRGTMARVDAGEEPVYAAQAIRAHLTQRRAARSGGDGDRKSSSQNVFETRLRRWRCSWPPLRQQPSPKPMSSVW